MRKISGFFMITALLLAITVMSPALTRAQDAGGGGIKIEWAKPSMDNTELLNSAFFVGGWMDMGKTLDLEFSLPFGMFNHETFDNESGIGNPRIGIIKSTEGSLSYSLGLSIPLAPDNKGFAMMTGALADPMRQGAFAPDTWTVDGAVNFMKLNEGGLSFFAGAGPTVMLPTDDAFDTEIFINFYAAGMHSVDKFNFGAGITGFYWASADDGEFWITGDDTFVYQAVAGGTFNMGSVNPGLWITIPLSEDYKDTVSTVIGVSIGIPIG
ncbi:hypothetical protein ACFL41_02330 [Gemmatimonadota bacterium]